MEITLDKHAANEALIKITLNEADYQPKVDAKIKDYVKKANIKGFRPGKAPFGMVKNLYGTSVLVEEINQILSSTLGDFIKKQEFKVLGDPLPVLEDGKEIDWKKQKDFDFSYKIGFVETVTVDLDVAKEVKDYKVEVSEKELSDAITNIKRQYGKMTNPEVSAENDFLYGDLKSADGSFEKTLSLPLSKIDSEAVPKFIGVEKGAVIELDPANVLKEEAADLLNISEEEAKNLSGDFTFTVQNINRTEEAELNQELFDKLFGVDQVKSEEEFLEKVKEILAENYNREMQVYAEEEIKKLLIEHANIDLPESFLKEWLLKANGEKLTESDIEKEYPAYARQLVWSLVSNKIAEENGIKAEHEDVIEKTKAMIRQQLASSGLGAQMESNMDLFVNNYLQGNEGQNYMQMITSVQNDKVVAFIKEKAQLEEEIITVEKFNELLEN
ncbi:Cell division trigger factor [Lunatimonas lonarensis]|uniref:Cell division trigger factor n=1 Tax=Lunatimonas lonarensis TaxID=1232681 RepID=R7ZYH5_9BACT|nr:trigger factor [Lunatimonas lonarensis]EON79093.1 Cell division trigger factor [Lunatimonas lonarensis]